MNKNQNKKNKIGAAFDGKKAFIAYLMAGDPNAEATRAYILAAAKAGANIIELGIPFSDPVAEGETLQKANLRALRGGMNVSRAFELAGSLRAELEALGVPLLFMTYVNPVLNAGYDHFFSRCVAYGVSGVILPDVPFEEQDEVLAHTENYGVDLITLIAPTSGARAERLAKTAKGYIYLVSSMGVTGVRKEITTDFSGILADIRRVTDTPVAVGFGVHSPEQARALTRGGAQNADGVIVGSAIVEIIEQFGTEAEAPLTAYVRSMRAALDTL